ncbi:MAG: GDSL-type esterase/lipase family protein [Tepidisphaeraceae bacterium]
MFRRLICAKPVRLVVVAIGLLLIGGAFAYFGHNHLTALHANAAYFLGLPFPAEWDRAAADHNVSAASMADGDCVMIGDSLMSRMPPDLLPPDTFICGLPGDTTTGTTYRIRQYAFLNRASVLFISVGINDLGKTSDDGFLDRYRQLLDALPADKPIVCSCILPVDRRVFTYPHRENERIRVLNVKLQKLVESKPNRTFVWCWDEMLDDEHNLRRDFHWGDGLHVNRAAYEVWTAKIRPALALARDSTRDNAHATAWAMEH